MCNDANHSLDACPDLVGNQLAMVYLAVNQRAKMPPLKLGGEWWKYLDEWHDKPGFEIPKTFPWLPDFSEVIRKSDRLTRVVTNYYRLHSREDLPEDRRTQNLSNVNELYGLSIVRPEHTRQ